MIYAYPRPPGTPALFRAGSHLRHRGLRRGFGDVPLGDVTQGDGGHRLPEGNMAKNGENGP